MRTVIIIVYLAIYIIVHLPLLAYFKVKMKDDPYKVQAMAQRRVAGVFRVMCALAGVKTDISGQENIPEGAVLFIANHRSFFDIFITYPLSPAGISFIAQDGLRKIPFIGTWGDAMQILFFNRSDMKQSVKMILQGIARLKAGKPVFVFPEGTRNKGESELPLLPFKDGTFKLATKTGCPIVPVAIRGTRAIWEAHMPWARPAKVSVKYGKPIYLNELSEEDRKHPAVYVQNVITEMLEQQLSVTG